MLTNEEWRPVIGFEGKYRISNVGNIYSELTGKMLKKPVTRKGYYRVTLHNDGIQISEYIHKLVLCAFAGEKPTPEHMSRHINGIKTDNWIDNLMWGTREENEHDKIGHGHILHGEDHGCAILNENDVIYIRNNYIKSDRDYGAAALGRKFGVDRTTVRLCAIGKTWKTISSATRIAEAQEGEG